MLSAREQVAETVTGVWPSSLSLGNTTMRFPGGSVGKETACNEGDPGLIAGLGRSTGEGNGNSLQYSCLGKSHGQRSLAGYSPNRGGKELDTT